MNSPEPPRISQRRATTAFTTFQPDLHLDLETPVKKTLLAIATACLIPAATSFAADGRIPAHSLNNMGLAGMKSMTDNEGLTVRGMGSTVGGFGVATVPGAAAVGTFYASGGKSASGFNVTGAVNNFTYAFGAGAARAHN